MEDYKYTRPDPVELTAEELKAVSGGAVAVAVAVAEMVR
jgi:bacteriocin-like protein